MNNFYTDQLKKLIGYRITGIALDHEGEFFGLIVKKGREKRETIIWFLKDDEGNGPGAFDIQRQG